MMVERSKKLPSVTKRLLHLVSELSLEEKRDLTEALEEKLKKEQRRHPRKPSPLFADVASNGRAYREFIKDISKGGVFIQTRMPFTVGESVVLILSNPVSEAHVKITGHIKRVDDTGVGVQFDVNSPVQESALKSFFDKL